MPEIKTQPRLIVAPQRRKSMTDTMQKYGLTFERTADGGWLEVGARLPKSSTALICDDAVVMKQAAANMTGGEFRGGEFWGGVFWGGEFRDGVFRGGEFWGGVFRGGAFWGGVFWGGEFRGGEFRRGVFHGGEFWGGVFRGGEFWGGVFRRGVFRGGEFWGGVFRGGEFWGGVFRRGEFCSSPCCAQRHDGYMFVAKLVDGDLRIWAGCRDFSWDEAIAHWNDDHRHGAESQRIIHFLKAQAEAEAERDAAWTVGNAA